MNDILPWSDRCHETMTTDRTCLLNDRYITMLWPLSWDNDNWRSLFHTLEINDHALSVVMNDNLIVTLSACTINRRPYSDTWIHAPSQWVFKLPLSTCTITWRFHSDSWVHVPSQGWSIVALECCIIIRMLDSDPWVPMPSLGGFVVIFEYIYND